MTEQSPSEEDTEATFESLLASRHEAIVRDDSESTQSTVTPLQFRLRHAEACLRSLEELRLADIMDCDEAKHDSLAASRNESQDSFHSIGPSESDCTFGRFQIVRALGSGGQAFVYLAFDPTLEREVALKIPHPEAVATPELRARFVREARAAAGLDHPHLVTVYEAGNVGPVCFIASRFCQGPNLAEWIRAQLAPVPVELATTLVAQLAEAVEYIHGHGILHRDLKPSNIMVECHETLAATTAKTQNIHVRITDFGLAKGSAPAADLTHTGTLLGTPQYMAPEQAESRHSEVGPHTDVYGLGIVLYELLTGRTPFRGKSDLETLQQVIAQTPISPRSIRHDVSRNLETVCMKAIAREPERRYVSAADLADDLHRLLANEPVRARPVGVIERLWLWHRRNRVVASLVALSVLLLLSLLAAGAVFSFVYRTERDYAREQERIATGQRDRVIREGRIAAHNLYAANMQLAQRELERGNLERVLSLLESHRPAPGTMDLRGFEWSYLWRRCHRDVVLRGHQEEVRAVQYLSDGRLVSASNDSTALIWDATSGRILATLAGHGGPVQSIAVVPTMGMLASGDEEGSIRLWDVATGLCRRVFEGHQNGVTSLAISPCGRRMASASWDNTIRIWDLESGREQAVLHRPSDERPGRDMFVGVAWTLDGRAVIAASLFSEVIFWDIDTSQQFAVLRAHTGNLTGLAISPNGRILATASEDSTVKLWDLGTLTGQNRAVVQYIERGTDRAAWVGAGVASGAPQIFISPDVTLTGHTGPIAQVAFSPDSRQLATSAVDGTVRLWDAATGQQTIMFDGHTGSVSCVAFASDGRTLASGGNDRTIRTWDVHAARPHRAPSSDLVDQWAQEMPVPSSGKRDERPGFRVAATVQTLGFSPDSRLLAIGGQKVRDDLSIENLTLRHVRTGKQQPHVQTSSLFVRGFAFCDGGRQLIANAQTTPGVGRVVRWNLETGEEQLLFINETESIWSLAVTPDGKKLYAATGLLHQRGTVVEFDMATRQRSIRFRKEGDYVRALVLSPDGSVLVAATGDGGVIVWRDDAEQPQSFRAHHQRVLQVAFAADGRSFATASSDATVKIWDVITLRQTGALVGHTHGVTSLAWSPEGKTLASGSADGTIKLWDPLISHERMSIDNKAGVVRSLAFSADGSILAAGTEDGAVFLFEASSSSECDSMRKTSGN